MTTEKDKVFTEEYMPYVIKWGKRIAWLMIVLIFIPVLVLIGYFGARPSTEGFITGFIALFSAMAAWYIVDPITLYPILHIPGLYLTYIGGNSKEIRSPAAMSALSSADVEAGTPEGTVISAIGISISLFISIAIMTFVAIAGNAIINVLPEPIVAALNYLLPALFGAMWVQRIMADYKTAAFVIPIVGLLRVLHVNGVFSILPLDGGYAQIFLSVLVGIFVSRQVNSAKIKKEDV